MRELWVDGKLRERWDDVARRYAAFDEAGNVELRRGFNNTEKQFAATAAVMNPLDGFVPSNPADIGVPQEELDKRRTL